MYLPRENSLREEAPIAETHVSPITVEEYQAELAELRRVGYIALHCGHDFMKNQQHFAIHPNSEDMEMWWTGLSKIDPKRVPSKLSMAAFMGHGVARIDGLRYAGVNRRTGSRFLPGRRYEYVSPEQIEEGDQLNLRGAEHAKYTSYPVKAIDFPISLS